MEGREGLGERGEDVSVHNVNLIPHFLLFPYRQLVALWQVLTGDTQLMTNVIKHLLEVLVLTLPYQERSRTSATSGVASYQRTETPIPKAVSE